MSSILRCYTLFDVTQTGVLTRSKPSPDENQDDWLYRRNTQCNLDTIIQAISLRSLPEMIDKPKLTPIRFDKFTNFGFLFEQEDESDINCWTFDFSVQHHSIFYNGISKLGALYSDCDQVPMIKTNTSWDKLPSFLDSTDELRNIYFEVITDE